MLESPVQSGSASSSPADQEVASSEGSDQFPWTKQWYPVAVVAFLATGRPHAIQVLGKDLVLWRDGTGSWRCFDDACPHRLAPLSEGRVESDGTLLCAYHAWRFDGVGQCVRLPQSRDAETEARFRSNPRACAIRYPTVVRQGLVWVWPEPGAEATHESSLRLPRLIPELDEDSAQVATGSWNFRDLPYGWDFFMENVADPAHVPVSHHGLVGNRYTDARYVDMPVERAASSQEGFSFGITPTAPTVTSASHDFRPPCLMRIDTSFDDGSRLLLVLYATPTRPGWCRHIGRQVLVRSPAGTLPKGLAFFGLPLPTWLLHILSSLFLHQDLVFLHQQEIAVARRSGTWHNKVFTPNPQDRMVNTFREWLHRWAGGGVPWPEHCLPLSATERREELFNVWDTHTRNCETCQQALRNLDRLRVVVFAAAALLVIVTIGLDGRGANTPAVWTLLAGAVLLGVGGLLLQRLRRLFFEYEFSHADND